MIPATDIAIIGAGPYGLSLGSHLRARGADVRVFGLPMQTWRESMPTGMRLKSEGFASNLSDPARELTLEAYCSKNGIPYADTGLPVNVETFVSYGEAFQRRFIPDLERKMVVSVEPAAYGFELRLDSGEVVAARRVVVASGIRPFDYIPLELRGLPREFLTHSVAYGSAAQLSGRDVIVVGAGASAMDVVALLRADGANPTVLTRRRTIRFQSPLGVRSLFQKVTAPMTPLGPGWKSVLCVKAPMVFHAMPEPFRVDVVRRYLGPAPAWFVREQVEGHVPYITGSTLVSATASGSRVRIVIRDVEGQTREIFADHVVAATGYRVDLDRLTFLGERIQSSLRRADGAPALSRNFESNLPGLYFVGTAAANSFGPMMRFAYGADYSARRLSRHLTIRLARYIPPVAKASSNIEAERPLQ
ncbi:MAG: NAD(P)-binding domain-containing protein [Bradyrhizobium sp.]